MSYKDRRVQGSFRGINFFIDTSETPAGRRVVFHEFPNRDTPYAEDLGLNSGPFEVEGHVIGDDYDLARNDLIDAFNAQGPGELSHPFYGTLTVQCGPATISESNREGAIATFSVTFYPAGDNRFPRGVNDKAATLQTNIDNSTVEAKAEFDESFSIDNLPGFAIESASTTIANASAKFDEITKVLGDKPEKISELSFQLRNLVADTTDLLQAPSKLSSRLLDSFELLRDTITNSIDQVSAFDQFFQFGNDDDGNPDIEVIGSTPTRNRERNNLNQLNAFIQRAAVIKSASSAQDAEYPSIREAEETRNKITDRLEEELIDTPDTEYYQSVADLKASLYDAVPDVDSDLPGVTDLELDDTSVSTLLAYDLYQDPAREQDIVDRNGIQHPGFIPKDTVLEVVDDN